MFATGVVLLTTGLAEAQLVTTEATPAPNYGLIKIAVCQLLSLVEGALGALIMVVAGMGAIVASAMGAYRLGVSLLVVAIGSFILRSLVSIFFGEFPDCIDGGTISAPNTTITLPGN